MGSSKGKTVREYGDTEADRVAKRLGMRVTKNSGGVLDASEKCDMRSDSVVMEHKRTTKKSYSLKAEELLKLYRQAMRGGLQDIAFAITFDVLESVCPHVWVLLPLEEYETLLCREEIYDE